VHPFEFKVVELALEGRALQQLKDAGYADQYRADDRPTHLIGVEFSRERRSVVRFEIERLNGNDADYPQRTPASKAGSGQAADR
jgi:hypothetical protein